MTNSSPSLRAPVEPSVESVPHMDIHIKDFTLVPQHRSSLCVLGAKRVHAPSSRSETPSSTVIPQKDLLHLPGNAPQLPSFNMIEEFYQLSNQKVLSPNTMSAEASPTLATRVT